MNKAIILLRRSMVPVLAIVASGILFTSCLKDKDGDNSTIPAAGLMAFNLAPGQQSVVVTLDGNFLTQTPLGYTNYTGTYLPVYIGSRKIEAFDYQNSKKLASTTQTFENDKYYSVFVIGSDSTYRNVVASDDVDSSAATSGNAFIRYVNAITDSVNLPAVTITAGGNNVVSENAPYAGVSGFKAVTPGTINIAIKNSNGVDASRSITVEQKKAYTILLVGKPGATDEATKPQIKFILNGTVSTDASK
jgi:hypothetical protein